MSLVCSRMPLVCHLHVTRMWFYQEPFKTCVVSLIYGAQTMKTNYFTSKLQNIICINKPSSNRFVFKTLSTTWHQHVIYDNGPLTRAALTIYNTCFKRILVSFYLIQLISLLFLFCLTWLFLVSFICWSSFCLNYLLFHFYLQLHNYRYKGIRQQKWKY